MNLKQTALFVTTMAMIAGAVNWFAAQQIALAERGTDLALMEARTEINRLKLDLERARTERDDVRLRFQSSDSCPVNARSESRMPPAPATRSVQRR